jgi:O-antigen ligase
MSVWHPYENSLVTRRPAESPVCYLAAPFIATAAGCTLVLSSAYGAKWFVMFFLATVAFFVLMLFKRPFVFGALLLACCAPIVFQYKLLTHGENGRVFDHFGGAVNEPVLSLVDFPILFLGICWVANLAIHRKDPMPKWTGFDSLVVLFLLISCLSLLNSTEHALFTFEMLRYLKYLVLYWSLRTFLEKNDKWVLWGIFAMSLLVLPLQALVSVLQYFFFFVLPIPVGGVSMASFELVNGELIQRVTGFVGHSNTFAHYLLIPLTFAMVLFFVRTSILWKIAVFPLLLCGLISLVLTFSRSGWLTVCLCGSMVGLAALLTGRLKVGYVVVLLLAGFFVLGWVMLTDVWETVMVRVFEDSGNAYESRLDLAMVGLRMIGDHPLIGIGLNSFEEHMPKYDVNGIINIIDRPVHNVFLLIAAETGIAAAFVFFAIGVVLVRYSYRILKGHSEREFYLGTVGLTVFLALGFTNCFDLSLRHEALLAMSTLVTAVTVYEYTRVTKPHSHILTRRFSHVSTGSSMGISSLSTSPPQVRETVSPDATCSSI